MAVVTGFTILFLLFLLGILVGGIFLQIYLSKKDGKWLGLILPLITFSLSLLVVFGMAAYVGSETFTVSEFVDGELVTRVVHENQNRQALPGAVAGAIFTFIMMNIPTVILLIIYKAVREKDKRQREVEKMSVHDL